MENPCDLRTKSQIEWNSVKPPSQGLTLFRNLPIMWVSPTGHFGDWFLNRISRPGSPTQIAPFILQFPNLIRDLFPLYVQYVLDPGITDPSLLVEGILNFRWADGFLRARATFEWWPLFLVRCAAISDYTRLLGECWFSYCYAYCCRLLLRLSLLGFLFVLEMFVIWFKALSTLSLNTFTYKQFTHSPYMAIK